jgi:double-stranded uracil-DNA glycosylase
VPAPITPPSSAATPPTRPTRPTAADLAAATALTLPDVIGPNLSVLFSGINPGLYSAATGHHFARPGNRFWPALHQGGFTDRQLGPDEQDLLPSLGLGITNVVARATARADELTETELHEGGRILVALVERVRPRWLAILGVTAYRTAFGRRLAAVGPQPERLGDTRVWILPNPSGLNAHWSASALAEAFRDLRLQVEASAGSSGGVHMTGSARGRDRLSRNVPGTLGT